MGCDIHCYAEKKVNGKWEKITKAFPNPYHRPGEENKIDEDGYEWNAEFTDHPYSGRNYDLFGILADVRNGRGCAGIKTGEGFNPISEPKGIPDDVSPEIEKESDSWGQDGHSHSWFTLKELLDYDWNQVTVNCGVVTLNAYKKFRKTKQPPEYYCGSVSGPSVRNVSNEEMDTRIEKNKFEKGIEYHTQISWETTYRDAVGKFFFEKTIKYLENIAIENGGSHEDVRIVFWFDN